MRLCYVLLSPTFGMHQYTADYANRMAEAGHDIHLITTTTYPADRYAPNITIHTPITTHNTGFNLDALRSTQYAVQTLSRLLQELQPNVTHFTGPHLWNPLLLRRLRRAGIPTIHTLHDLDPHPGSPYGPLLHLWNGAVLRYADHILVHGQRYKERLARYPITYLSLLHLFLGYELSSKFEVSDHEPELPAPLPLSPSPSLPFSSTLTVLFFGRLEIYKGVTILLEAWARYKAMGGSGALLLAGSGDLPALWPGDLPPDTEFHNRRIEDAEALQLFQRCSLVVLPYIGATQSALIPAAYAFGKPVIATCSGALPEYVVEGETGWLVPPGDPPALAATLSTALSDPARLAAMGKAGRVWYNRERIEELKTLLALYRFLARE